MGVLLRKMLHVFLQPLQLFVAEAAQAAGFQVHHVHQPDEVHAVLVEAVPAGALRALAVALAILLAVVVQHVVLAGHEEDVLGAGGLQHLVDGVELSRLREMADVAGVQHERRSDRQRIDLVDRGLQGRDHVRIRRLVESHVAVADLHETEFALVFMAAERETAQAVGIEHAALDHAKGARAGPRHALQESSAVNSVVVVVMQISSLSVGRTLSKRFLSVIVPMQMSSECPSRLLTDQGHVYSRLRTRICMTEWKGSRRNRKRGKRRERT